MAARQPVHTVYLPADRYAADTLERWRLEATAVLDRHAPTAEAFPEAFGIGAGLAAEVHDRVRAKLEREPVEDLRVDFEDGYGDRGDDEEDLAAVTAATALRHTVAAGRRRRSAASGSRAWRRRPGGAGCARWTLFVGALAEGGGLPDGFVVTLPKVTSVEQVAAMVLVCERLEQAHGLAAGALRFEIQVETPQAVLGADGTRAGRADGARVGAAVHRAALRDLRLLGGVRDRAPATRAWSTRWPTTPRR